ncbi:MAG: hypothetical protein RLW62_16265 [Gammaproteobacteria bacterium]
MSALPVAVAVAADDDGALAPFSGHWVLDADASDDAEDAFDGKLRKRSRAVELPIGSAPGNGRPTVTDRTQENYWRALAEKDERRSERNLRRLGTVYPLVTSGELDISPQGDGLRVVYDGTLPRFVRPNPAGRVFSASGDELVSDTIGYTLAYFDGADLVLETDPPDGGKYVERLHLVDAGRRIEYHVKMRGRVLLETVELVRSFTRAGEPRALTAQSP